MTVANGALERIARRVWSGTTPADRAVRVALVPAALVYGAVAHARNRLYDLGWLATNRVPAHVVSVGNITVGGTGKTPTTLWLAQRLAARGHRVGIVARGYGKQRRGVVVVGESGRPLVGPEEGGDEAVMMARRFAGPVVTGEIRAEAAATACRRFALDTIVLDDGYQHRALARDADLVLATADLTTAWPLPAGPLRESPHRLTRASAILAVDGTAIVIPGVPTFHGKLEPMAVVRVSADDKWIPEPLAGLRGTRVVATAGIANPDRFTRTLTRIGIEVDDLIGFPDHHQYTQADANHLATIAGTRPLFTTEKDLPKLAHFEQLKDLRALRVDLEVENADSLIALLTRAQPQ